MSETLDLSNAVPVQSIDRPAVLVELPQTPGFYLWHILDLNYLEVGLVQVMEDSEKHRDYLGRCIEEHRTKGTAPSFYLYRNSEGRWLTMYHQADPHHLPECDADGEPYVDGYRPVDFDWIFGDPPTSPPPR